MASAIDAFTAKRTITTTSMITVTPMTTWVNGPLARSSLMIAIAEDGERATMIPPARMATAARSNAGKSCANGISSSKRKTATAVSVKVKNVSPAVTQAMLLSFPSSSLR